MSRKLAPEAVAYSITPLNWFVLRFLNLKERMTLEVFCSIAGVQ